MRKEGWEGKYYRSACPYCGSVTALYNTETNFHKCYKCLKILHYKPNVDIRTVRSIPYTLLNLPTNLQLHYPEEVIEYVNSRRVTEDMLREVGITYNRDTMSLRFPLSPINKLYPSSYIERSLTGKFYNCEPGMAKEAGGYVFGLNNLLDTNYIVITEGVFDVLSPSLIGVGLAVVGCEIFKQVELFLVKNYKHALIWFDPDAEAKAKGYATKFKKTWGLDTYYVTGHDHDPGDCKCIDFIQNVRKGNFKIKGIEEGKEK